MKKLLAILALFVLLGSTVLAAPMTLVYGKITLEDGTTPVSGATVVATCNGNEADSVLSDGSGMYYIFFPASECATGDEVNVVSTLDEWTDNNSGIVSYDSTCRLNAALVNISIPELGVIGAGVALIGAIAGFAIFRKKN